MIPVLIPVVADKGGVGKTTVARLLMDYFTLNHRQPRAFDAEYRNVDADAQRGNLKRFFAEAKVVDFTRSEGHIEVLDSLLTSPMTILDLRAGITLDSLQMLSDIGFMDKSKNGEIKIVTMHVLDGSVAALDEVADAARLLGASGHYLIRNHHVNERDFFGWNADLAKKVSGDNVIDIPKLDKRASEAVDAMGVGFEEFTRVTGSATLKGYVQHFLRRVYAEFDRRGLSAI